MGKKSTPKKKTARKPAPKENTSTNISGGSANGAVTTVLVRMYRAGTGDFFILQFKKANGEVTFKLMIDCGCIHGGTAGFKPFVDDLAKVTDGEIDLLIVTHEHADHINGFEKATTQFAAINFKKVWFAWTESKEDKVANNYRKNNTKMKMALASATQALTRLREDQYYTELYEGEVNSKLMVDAKDSFIDNLEYLSSLSTEIGDSDSLAAGSIPTMEDLLRKYKVIKEDTVVEFLAPGDLVKNLPGATGMQFFILGPPKDLKYLNQEEKKGQGYQKREKPSTVNFSFVNSFTGSDTRAFDSKYEGTADPSYSDKTKKWRNIDNEWLYSAGSLALRLQTSINNTSLVVAIQFVDSERVLLFPGDAEYGNWISWHDGLEWTIQKDGKSKEVNAEYLLNNTIFYKVGHHLSQNGTAKEKGFEMMKQSDFVAMATLDFKKINSGWLNTMPNDILAAALIAKSGGNLYFVGDAAKILKNIQTKRASVSASDVKKYNVANGKFDGMLYLEHEVSG